MTAGAARISELEAAVEADNDVSTRSAVGANFVGTNLSSLSLLNIFVNHFHLDVNFLTFPKPNKLLSNYSLFNEGINVAYLVFLTPDSKLQDARYVIKSVICDPNFERLVLGCIEAKFCK